MSGLHNAGRNVEWKNIKSKTDMRLLQGDIHVQAEVACTTACEGTPQTQWELLS